MGVVLVRDPHVLGMVFVEPSSVAPEWKLRLGPPLLSPQLQYMDYLGSLFTGALKNGLPFAQMWALQIMSAAAWLNGALLSGYGRGEVMRAMHKGVFWAYATSPHDMHATVKAVYHMSYRLPRTQVAVVKVVALWLRTLGCWCGDTYSSWYLVLDVAVQGITSVWDTDFECVTRLASDA